MIGYHYSFNATIPKGSIIKSDQDLASSYKIVHQIYSQVAKELGIYYPEKFGYAYAKKQPRYLESSWGFHIVEADDKFVTCGNLRYSTFVTMDCMNSLVKNFKQMPLAERLEARAEAIRKNAIAYFTDIGPDDEELISDRFIVI